MPFDRAATLRWLRTEPRVPVLIVGGGINGAGVLRELALNGVDALLVDKADFAAGATSASSRMIHGGLRYLENGEFRLVREALRERNRLLRNAPHCVFPLATVIPLRSRFAGLAQAARKFLDLGGAGAARGLWLVRAGLTMYETFAGREHRLPRHRVQSGAVARARRPRLHPGVIATATYYDAWNPAPERLCLEVLDDATRLHAGAHALNYCAVVGATRDDVELRDMTTGEQFRIRPQMVVNATGAWIDFANHRLGHATAYIGGTRGSHLVVDHPELHALTDGEEIFYENEDGRICLILPLHGRVLVGTTDIRTGDPDQARCDEAEVRYLVAAVQEVFPAVEIRPEHVIARFCGVRPLPRSDEHVTGRISRDHACRELPADDRRGFPVFSLVGGKWTTFRAFAAGVADRLLAKLGSSRRAGSEDLPIGGGRDHPDTPAARQHWIESTANRFSVPPALVQRLFTRHGTRAASMLEGWTAAHMDEERELGPCLEAELDHICRHEAVVHLDDLLIRRTELGLFGHLDASRLARCAEIAAVALQWDEQRKQAELARAEKILTTQYGVALDRPRRD